MSFNLRTKYPNGTIDSPTDYPQGEPRNVIASGDGLGFPWNSDWIKNIEGFFQYLMRVSSTTPSGVADTALVSDYITALRNSGILSDGAISGISLSKLTEGQTSITVVVSTVTYEFTLSKTLLRLKQTDTSTSPSTVFDSQLKSTELTIDKTTATSDYSTVLSSESIQFKNLLSGKPYSKLSWNGINYTLGPGAADTNSVFFRPAIYTMPLSGLKYGTVNDGWELEDAAFDTPELFQSDILNGSTILGATATYTDVSGNKNVSPAQLTYIQNGTTNLKFGLIIRGGQASAFQPDILETVKIKVEFDASGL